MPIQGRTNDNRELPKFLRTLKAVSEFKRGDVIQDTEPVGWPDDHYGHPKGGGFRVVDYFILSLIEPCGGQNKTLWMFWAVDTTTHKIERVRFTDLRWYPVV
jgi:hypothetical protein